MSTTQIALSHHHATADTPAQVLRTGYRRRPTTKRQRRKKSSGIPDRGQQIQPPPPKLGVDNTRSLRQRQTRRKAATQSHGPTVSFWDRVAGPPKAPEWVGDRHLCPRGRSASLVRPHLDGEIAVASITFDARGLVGSGAPKARPDHPAATAMTGSSRSPYALTGAVGRSHTTPTPDPDPRDSGRRTSGALRLSELASCLCTARPKTAGGTVLPGRAQGLHFPAPLTHQSNGARSPLANTLGSARPTPTASARAAAS